MTATYIVALTLVGLLVKDAAAILRQVRVAALANDDARGFFINVLAALVSAVVIIGLCLLYRVEGAFYWVLVAMILMWTTLMWNQRDILKLLQSKQDEQHHGEP